MSCYVVESSHVEYLVVSYAKLKKRFNEEYSESGSADLANLLMKANVDSVNERYGCDDEAVKVDRLVFEYDLKIPQLMKSLLCYEYQLEGDIDGVALKFCSELKRLISLVLVDDLRASSAYESSEWGCPVANWGGNLGRVVLTQGAVKALETGKVPAKVLLQHHFSGDFGVLCSEDVAQNRSAIADGGRVMSSYKIFGESHERDVTVWVITDDAKDANSPTTLLLPSDY